MAIVVPPRRSVVSAGSAGGPWAQRKAALERLQTVGRREWQKETGCRQQARVENGFFPIQVRARRSAEGKEQQGSKQSRNDRVPNPQPDGLAW